MNDETYLMPSHVRLLVSDVERSIPFYEGLGFTCINRDGVFVHLRWAKYADVFLVVLPNGAGLGGQRGLGVLLAFYGGDIPLDAIAARAVKLGAAVDGPKVMPWFSNELVVTDPDGYRLVFVMPTDPVLA